MGLCVPALEYQRCSKEFGSRRNISEGSVAKTSRG